MSGRIKRTKVGAYKTVYEGQFFKIQEAEATMPDGSKKTFERAVRLPSVSIIAIDEKKNLLLTREWRLLHKKYVWRLPGGRGEWNESPLASAKRELQEEAGVKARRWTLFHRGKGAQTLLWPFHAYVARGLTMTERHGGEGDEDITVVPTPLRKALKMALDGEITDPYFCYFILKLAREKKRWGL
jgi:ADP-ribose pyrophosphatase